MMKSHLLTQIEIHASAERVWQVFADFDRYPEWNPFIQAIKGVPVVGEQLEAELPGMTITPKVLAVEEAREFRWRGTLWWSGLFSGEHYFHLEPRGVDSTRFVHGEHFSGLLEPLLRKKLHTETKAGFESMNEALKARVESGS